MLKIFLYIIVCIAPVTAWCQDTSGTAKYRQQLLKAYPSQIAGVENNYVLFKNGAKLLLDDKKKKTLVQLNDQADIEDQLKVHYVKGKTPKPAPLDDPGRIRNDSFFKCMYGSTPAAVKQQLVTITWLPNTAPQKLQVTRVNGVDQRFKAVSDELEKHPELLKYVKQAAGTFNWRVIKGTRRLSTHSYGIAIDINTNFSNYWQWDNKTTDEYKTISQYNNRIPIEIVAIFEKQGFIWGGKWYHYDTMHFEYRPELLGD